MYDTTGNAGEELLSESEYRDLDRKLSDLHQELSDLARRVRYHKQRNHELERNLNSSVTALDQLRRNLERQFGRS